MPRSRKKGPFVDHYLHKKIALAQKETAQNKRVIATYSRRSTITPEMVGLWFAIHNGRKFITVLVTEQMVDHKLGEFALTRTFHGHSGEKKGSASAR